MPAVCQVPLGRHWDVTVDKDRGSMLKELLVREIGGEQTFQDNVKLPLWGYVGGPIGVQS